MISLHMVLGRLSHFRLDMLEELDASVLLLSISPTTTTATRLAACRSPSSLVKERGLGETLSVSPRFKFHLKDILMRNLILDFKI